MLQRTIERCGFARACRTGDQHHALRRRNGVNEFFQIRLFETDFLNRQGRVTLQQTDTNALSIFARQHIKARIDVFAIRRLKRNCAILRQTLFGNIAIGQNFETGNDGQIIMKQKIGKLVLRLQHAIYAKSDARRFAIRLNVNIAGIGGDGLLQNIIDEFDNHSRVVNIIGRASARRRTRRLCRRSGRGFLFLLLPETGLHIFMAHTGGELAGLDEKELNILIAQRLNLIGQSRLGRVNGRHPQEPPFAGKGQNMLAVNHIFGHRGQCIFGNLTGRQIFAPQGISPRQDIHHQLFFNHCGRRLAGVVRVRLGFHQQSQRAR